jgi:hypothetical protein
MSKLHQVNYFDCTEEKQELQNATYQEILHVLKEFLLDKTIIFIIDRKVAIDIMENLPKTQKERQEAHHIDTLTQIIEQLEKRTAKTLFNHCYSHMTENNESQENNLNNVKKIKKIINKYEKEKTNRYIELNQLVDKLTDRAKDETKTYISYTTNIKMIPS